MVLKPGSSSNIEEEEEEDLYLRKCNVRKTKRLNGKMKKMSLQERDEELRYAPESTVFSHLFHSIDG
jgi:hypothetical protein